MPPLAYYIITAVLLLIAAVVLAIVAGPLWGIFTVLVAQFVANLEARNE